jgi:AraC-like DNA-binding protein
MLFFLSGNDRYVGSQNPERSLKVYAVHFDADKGSIPCFAVKVKDPVFYEKICMRIISAQEGEDSVQAEQWLAAALQEARASLDSAGFGLSSNKNRISRIRERLRSIEGEPVTVKDMSRWFGSSRAHFGRIFKRETGLTPQEYLIARRIDRASILLSSTGYSLGRIAEITGYSDIFFFSRQFKAKTGICPSEFRKNPSRRRISHCL